MMLDLAPGTVENLRQVMILVVLAIAVVTDLRHRRVYNALTFPAMALGLVVNGVAGGPTGLLWSLGGLLLGGALFALPVAFLGRGAGDLKLLAAVGALGGPTFVLWSGLYAGVAGAVFAVAVLLARRSFVPVVAGMAFDVVAGQRFPQATSNIRLPYAVPIAVGTVAAMILT